MRTFRTLIAATALACASAFGSAANAMEIKFGIGVAEGDYP
jgi:hypothetical protein